MHCVYTLECISVDMHFTSTQCIMHCNKLNSILIHLYTIYIYLLFIIIYFNVVCVAATRTRKCILCTRLHNMHTCLYSIVLSFTLRPLSRSQTPSELPTYHYTPKSPSNSLLDPSTAMLSPTPPYQTPLTLAHAYASNTPANNMQPILPNYPHPEMSSYPSRPCRCLYTPAPPN